jgi:hypothetical protein
MYIQVNTEARLCNHLCHGKTTSITCPQCVCVCSCLSIQARKAHVTCLLSYVAYLTVLYFYTLSHKWHEYRGGKKRFIKCKICVLFFSITWSEIFLILRKTKQDIIKNVHRFRAKYPLFLSELQT